jgi:hypothetical protein
MLRIKALWRLHCCASQISAAEAETAIKQNLRRSSPVARFFPSCEKQAWQHRRGLKKLPPGERLRRRVTLVDGKQFAAMLRIKALWRLHCCASQISAAEAETAINSGGSQN